MSVAVYCTVRTVPYSNVHLTSLASVTCSRMYSRNDFELYDTTTVCKWQPKQRIVLEGAKALAIDFR